MSKSLSRRTFLASAAAASMIPMPVRAQAKNPIPLTPNSPCPLNELLKSPVTTPGFPLMLPTPIMSSPASLAAFSTQVDTGKPFPPMRLSRKLLNSVSVVTRKAAKTLSPSAQFYSIAIAWAAAGPYPILITDVSDGQSFVRVASGFLDGEFSVAPVDIDALEDPGFYVDRFSIGRAPFFIQRQLVSPATSTPFFAEGEQLLLICHPNADIPSIGVALDWRTSRLSHVTNPDVPSLRLGAVLAASQLYFSISPNAQDKVLLPPASTQQPQPGAPRVQSEPHGAVSSIDQAHRCLQGYGLDFPYFRQASGTVPPLIPSQLVAATAQSASIIGVQEFSSLASIGKALKADPSASAPFIRKYGDHISSVLNGPMSPLAVRIVVDELGATTVDYRTIGASEFASKMASVSDEDTAAGITRLRDHVRSLRGDVDYLQVISEKDNLYLLSPIILAGVAHAYAVLTLFLSALQTSKQNADLDYFLSDIDDFVDKRVAEVLDTYAPTELQNVGLGTLAGLQFAYGFLAIGRMKEVALQENAFSAGLNEGAREAYENLRAALSGAFPIPQLPPGATVDEVLGMIDVIGSSIAGTLGALQQTIADADATINDLHQQIDSLAPDARDLLKEGKLAFGAVTVLALAGAGAVVCGPLCAGAGAIAGSVLAFF